MKIGDIQKLAAFNLRQLQENPQQLHEFLLSNDIDPTNLYQELEMSSPFVNTHRDISYSNGFVSLHSHAFYEMLFCRSNGIEYLVGSNRYSLQKGDIVFVAPGISHRPILPEIMREPYIRDVLWISAELVNSLDQTFSVLTQFDIFGHAVIRTAGTQLEFLDSLFQNGVREEEQKRPCWESLVITNTITILSYLIRARIEHKDTTMRSEKPELLDMVTSYIEANYTKHISISELARTFYVSDSTISHLFKQKFGVSLYHYVTQRRLIAAKNLITDGLPLEQVAIRVGFTDYSAFFRAFKQQYGISPRQYRNL